MDEIHKQLVERMRQNFNLQLLVADTVSATKLKSLLEMSDEILSIAFQFNKKLGEKVDKRVEKLHGNNKKED